MLVNRFKHRGVESFREKVFITSMFIAASKSSIQGAQGATK